MSDAADGAPGGRAPDTGIAPRVPRNPVYTLFVTNQRIRGLLASALRDAPIRSDEYGVYSAVYMAGTLTLTQLARSTGMPLTTVADYVRSMVERGHLERRPNPDDRRSALLRLTPAGTETVNVVMPASPRRSGPFSTSWRCRGRRFRRPWTTWRRRPNGPRSASLPRSRRGRRR